jgi:hypothetical protein
VCKWKLWQSLDRQTFSIKNDVKQADASPQLLINFALECAVRGVQPKHEGLKFSATHQLLVLAEA